MKPLKPFVNTSNTAPPKRCEQCGKLLPTVFHIVNMVILCEDCLP